MTNDCIMPLGSLINKLLRGEADEWCETDFGFYLESLTHGDKKELEQVLETVDEAIVNWKSLSFISHYEDKIKSGKRANVVWTKWMNCISKRNRGGKRGRDC